MLLSTITLIFNSRLLKNIVSPVADSEKFLVKALKDAKLSSNASKEKRALLHQVQTIRQDYAQLDLGEPIGKPGKQ